MREKATGYLFQGRFLSCPMDDENFYIAAPYIEQNPVRAGLCKKPWDDPWSSAAFHTYVKRKDPLSRSSLEFPKPKEWRELLQYEFDGINRARDCTRTGRPCGAVAFMKRAEKVSGRVLSPKKRGPKGSDN